MAHIHFIYPDVETGYYPNIHHGLAFLVGALKSHGHQVSFHHIISPEPPKQVAIRALSEEPDVIGLSLCYNQMYLAEQYVRQIRQIGTNALLVAGGIHPTTDPEDVFSRLDIDAVAIGEAEYTIVALMDAISRGDADVHDVRGFYFRMPDGQMIRRAIPSLNPDLSRLPLPDYSVFDIERIIKDSGGWTTMFLTRGCPFNCYYCCNNVLKNVYPDKKDFFRMPPVEHAIALIKHNLGYIKNARGINFVDDLLCLNKDWFLAFTDAYRREILLPYTMNARVESLTDDVIYAMKKSKCRVVHIGVESGNPWIRRNLLNRHYSNEKLIEVFSKLRMAKILTSAFNMIGLPFETKNHMLDTLRINKKLRPSSGSCFYFFPYPKTRLYKICKEFNLLKEDFEKARGYFSFPNIKLTHCNPEAAKRICDRLRLRLYLSRVLINIKLGFAARWLYYLMIPFAGIISKVLEGDSKLKSMIRSFVYRTIPVKRSNKKTKIVR